MKNKIIISVFSCLVLLQIATPLSMIIKREIVLKDGVSFRFKTQPIDPYDAFRGRYVALRVEASRIQRPLSFETEYGKQVYAQIAVDKDGFAKISGVTVRKPDKGSYLPARVLYSSAKDTTLDLSIDRYYMEEKSAPRAEHLYRKYSAQNKKEAYIEVKIKDGFVVIEGLYIGDKKIEDLVNSEKQVIK